MEKFIRILRQLFFYFLFLVFQQAMVIFQEILVFQRLRNFMTMLLEFFFVDGSAETFHLVLHAMAVTFFHLAVHEIFYPLQEAFIFVGMFEKIIDGFFHHAVRVEFDVETAADAQFARQMSQNALKKTIDGFNLKMSIVVQNKPKRLRGIADNFFLAELSHAFGVGIVHLQFFLDFSKQTIGMMQGFFLVAKNGQIVQHAVFHFAGRLVGKGDGQDVLVSIRTTYQQFDVFQCQTIGFSAAGRGFVDIQFRHDSRKISHAKV